MFFTSVQFFNLNLQEEFRVWIDLVASGHLRDLLELLLNENISHSVQ